MQDRNKRILKILDDLDLTEDVHYPNWSVNEKPERLLVVDDSEVCTKQNFRLLSGSVEYICTSFRAQLCMLQTTKKLYRASRFL